MAESDGTYGYEPALSEDDVRAGKATKALEMMRYVGNRNGTYVILLLGTDASDTEISNRVSCQSPCNYAKSETLARVVFGALVTTVVRKTETIRVAPDSIIGAMLADAISGHLKPYGQGSGNTMPQAQFVPSATTPTATEANVPAQAQQSVGGDASAPQTSFDCSKPGTVAQYLICGDSALATSDRELADLVQQARNAVQDQAGFGERIKKQWNYREKNCKDKPCLAAWYAYEKDIMTKIAQSGDVNAK
ncbi:hypothetical protein [Paraburkholderia sp. J10-1]|uniref:hypothetical protein n=1 Tax=Paraburkholderia sp. J10-1 TaxID=2805430 RepID=UPI002AB5DF25|nr:hypothetical protein [Paraburkholderia sp. J10-1]